jgi:hypothetical protein
VEEAVDGAQTHVAGAALVASSRFKILEERRHALHGEILDRDLAGIALFSDNKLQQQFETVPVAVKRVGAQGALTGKVVGEEAMQGGGEG